jgi:hypothetical protein
MEDFQEFEKRFDEITFSLSESDVLYFDKFDNGPLHNVINRIELHCYGVSLLDEEKLIVEMFYANGNRELKGELIKLTLDEKYYVPLLLRFTVFLAEKYNDVDSISAFNNFQLKVRSFLEKIGFFTTTSLELKPYKGKSGVMMSNARRGIKHIVLIEHTEFYRDLFKNNYKIEKIKNKEYVYLMVNNDSGYIKIGTSINPRYRERTLHSQEPKIFIIAQWQCNKQIEKELHEKFKEKRVRGEWFNLKFKDLKYIEEYMSNYNYI